MTRQQAESLIKDWAYYQCDGSDPRIGPREYTAPMGSTSEHDPEFLHEYQFIQKQIEIHCSKSYDRHMMEAVLISHFYKNEPLQSVVVFMQSQVAAIEGFIGHLLPMAYAKPKSLFAETA